jgi:hypothetical protein
MAAASDEELFPAMLRVRPDSSAKLPAASRRKRSLSRPISSVPGQEVPQAEGSRTMTQTKSCTKCQRTFPATLEFFSRDKGNTSDQLKSWCRDCQNAACRALRARPEKKAALRKRGREWARRNREYLRKKGRVQHERLKRTRPEVILARRKVSTAIASGKLIAKPCERCGADKSQAHHDDYQKPLEVRWLCAIHHAEFHSTMKGVA